MAVQPEHVTMPASAAIDLSLLPAPDVIAPLSFEAILAEMTGLVQTGVPGVFTGIADFDVTNEADPAVKVLQVAAWSRLLDRARANDAAKAVMVAYARGADLDHLGALFQVARLTGESDDAFRARIVLAPDGFSVAGPESAYRFHALSADPAIADATAISPADGQVLVTLLSATGDGTVAPDLVAAVAAVLSSRTIRPLTDQVTVQSAEVINFAIAAQLITYDGPDRSVVLASALNRLNTYLARVRKLGRDITTAGLKAALFAEGAQNVLLTSPLDDVVCDATQVGFCTSIMVELGGVAA